MMAAHLKSNDIQQDENLLFDDEEGEEEESSQSKTKSNTKAISKKINQKSSSRKTFKCTICNYVTNVKARFTKHVKYHSMPLIKCDHCDFKTPYKWNLDRHYKNHNGEGTLCCPLCNFKCDIKQSLTVHVQNHHASVPDNIGELIKQTLGYGDACPVVQNTQQQQIPRRGVKRSISITNPVQVRNLISSRKTVKSSGKLLNNRKSSLFKCDKCNFTAWSEISLNRHLTQFHTQNHKKLCLIAPKPMPSLIPIPSKNTQATTSVRKTCPDLTPQTSNNKNKCDTLPNSIENMNSEDKSAFLEYFALKPKEDITMDTGEENVQISSVVVKKNVSQPKRRTSFFEKLTKKLVANSKSDAENSENVGGSSSVNSITITSNSTRCQYCRHRCKSSVDLIGHLGQCPVAKTYLEEDNQHMEKPQYSGATNTSKVFVWNNTESNNVAYNNEEEDGNVNENSYSVKSEQLDDLSGYEISPGIGSIELKEGQQYESQVNEADKSDSVTKSRKVYKCPQQNCGFWATTASRFHVHIVGHYNLKPFECSQCSYRSNWRWDITKHIKLKTHRDPAHSKAKVLLTHESGQRNYRKYDRYIVAMDVKYSADSKLPDCSTVASKRPDVELSPSSLVISPMTSPTGSSRNSNNGSPKLKMPKLTKAPGYISQSFGNSKLKAEAILQVMPPPTLKPIIPSTAISRTRFMLSGGEILQNMDSLGKEITVTPVVNMQEDFNLGMKARKNPMWKCKKCPFKHSNKETVVAHIRRSHKPKNGEPVSILNQNNLMPVDGDSEENDSEEETHIYDTQSEDFSYNAKAGLFKCKLCSFATVNFNAMKSHNLENHSNTQFICAYCSQTMQTRREMLEHMKMHESEKTGEEIANNNKAEGIITPEEIRYKPRGSGSNGKKYHCLECPYLTDSKGQFLYHKQFHVPSNEAFYKCSKCSYHVSHKHLLHQHLRVHLSVSPTNIMNNNIEKDYFININDNEEEEDNLLIGETEEDDDWEKQPNEIENQINSNHPTVLLWKNDKPYRVFRCRFCPTVFRKLDDLTEHEENHNRPENSYSPHEAINLSIPRNISPANSSASSLKFSANQPNTVLYFCDECPARFFYEKELSIHRTFHIKSSEFNCHLCSYSARQQSPHLMSHMKVHGKDYQIKTQTLLAKFPKYSDNYRNDQFPISITPANFLEKDNNNKSGYGYYKGDSSIDCKKCPAKFNTMASFVQHSNNHGRRTAHICRFCDYGADSANNLTLHAILHAGSEITIEPEPEEEVITISTTSKVPSTRSNNTVYKNVIISEYKDEDAFLGNPEFTYPTYVKNGRLKSKRYKCFKCPSAFEKRDQYRVHIGLHGSNQRYKCPVDKCDYAVTYYANFIQHLKKHENQPNISPELLIAKPLSKMPKEVTTVVQMEQMDSSKKREISITFKCNKCPFRSADKNVLKEHKSHHKETVDDERKPIKDPRKCLFCNFLAPNKNLLTEHIRLHFHPTNNNNNNNKAQDPDLQMFVMDQEIVGKGKDFKDGPRVLYSEKENQNESSEQVVSKSGGNNNNAIVMDLRRGLPVSFLNQNEANQKSH